MLTARYYQFVKSVNISSERLCGVHNPWSCCLSPFPIFLGESKGETITYTIRKWCRFILQYPEIEGVVVSVIIPCLQAFFVCSFITPIWSSFHRESKTSTLRACGVEGLWLYYNVGVISLGKWTQKMRGCWFTLVPNMGRHARYRKALTDIALERTRACLLETSPVLCWGHLKVFECWQTT